MNCRQARQRIFASQFEGANRDDDAEMQVHLRRCPACSARAVSETRLTEGLISLRRSAPFEIDVSARVLRTIADQAPDWTEIGRTQWRWATAATVLLALGLGVSLIAIRGDISVVAQDVAAILGGVLSLAARLFTQLLALIAVPFRMLGWLLDKLVRLAPMVDALRPTAIVLFGIAAVLMSTTIVVVVGRDLRGRPLGSGRLSLL